MKNTKKNFGTKFKFGIEVPRTGDVGGSVKLDEEKWNTLWFDWQKKEATSLRDLDTFKILKEGFDSTEYQCAPLIYAWDIKFDGRRKSRLVANDKATIGPPESDIWSGVVNIKSVKIILFLAKLNGLKILIADISSAYLMADTKEKIYTKLGPEFGD